MPGQVPAAAPSARRNGHTLAIVGAIIVIAALALGGGYVLLGVGGHPTHQVAGTFVLTDTDTNSSGITTFGSTCEGSGGYSDLSAGVSVILKDENDKTIATTSLGEGTGNSAVCTFHFTLADVPDNATFYNTQISHRGTVSFSHADMVKNGWTVELSMGS
jgi:serine/threonine-protein kinase